MTVKITLNRRLKDGNKDGKNGWQCSRYSAYLATGKKTIYSKAHPDYGPCNGSAMVNYLIKNYGWEKCKKEAGAIFSIPVRKGMPYGHTGMITDPKVNEVNDANWTKPLTVGTHKVNLEYYGATYCRPKTKKKNTIEVGDKVVPIVWIDYNGTPLVKTRDYYYASSITGDKVLLRADNAKTGVVYANVKLSNLKEVK